MLDNRVTTVNLEVLLLASHLSDRFSRVRVSQFPYSIHYLCDNKIGIFNSLDVKLELYEHLTTSCPTKLVWVRGRNGEGVVLSGLMNIIEK